MLHLKNLMGLLFLASVVMLSLFLLVPTVQANTPDLPEGVSQGDWQTIAAQVSAHRHQIVAAADGFQARNPDQQWLMHFDGQGFEVTPQGADWTWGLSLKSYGRNGAEQAVTGKPAIRAEGNRVEYTWDGALTEWIVNDARGLEHGFTLGRRPVGAGDDLRLTLVARGNLRPQAHTDGLGASFTVPSGAAVVNYSGLKVVDANGRDVPARIMVQGNTLRLAVDDRQAVYPLTIDPLAQQAYLKASNTGTGDQFGYWVAVSGDTMAVGAPGEASNATGVNGNQADNSVPNSGAVYVFVRDGSGNWSQQAYLKASNTGANDGFGSSVAVFGDTIVVGAHGEASNATGVNGNQADNSAPRAGAVYVFVRDGSGSWSQQAYLKASNTGAYDAFGWPVAVSGDTVAVGAVYEDSNATGVNGNQADNSATDAGAVYVFVRDGSGNWSQQAYLKASNTNGNDQFGIPVDVDGNTVAVGAIFEASNATGVNGNQADNSAYNAGAAYVFVRDGSGNWSQQAYLKASNTQASDAFAYWVALSGDTMVVSATNEASNATGVNGNQADNSAPQSGAVYVFVRDGSGNWSQRAYLKASNTDGNDQFGYSVAVSRDTVVVGTYQEASNATGVNGNQADNSAPRAGAVYVFRRDGNGNWSQQAYLKASNTEADDRLTSSSVAVDGNTVAVGAIGEASNATGVNGNQADNSASYSGAVYVFSLPNTAPVATGVTVTGTPQVGQTLAGLYTYGDAENDPQGVSTFQWYRADDAVGTNMAAIVGANAATYTVADADIDKYLAFTVMPVAQTGILHGIETSSVFIGPVSGAVTVTPFPSPSILLPEKLGVFVEIHGIGQGEVISLPAGIACSSKHCQVSNTVTGMQCDAQACSEIFPTGTAVVLQPRADADSVFSSWGGHPECADGEIPILYSSMLCIAYFRLKPHTLTVTPVNHGQVVSQPVGIQCTEPCSQDFAAHQAVTLSFIPEPGWQLTGWTGDCDPQGHVTLDRDKICSPVVILLPLSSYTLTVTGIEHGQVTSQPDGIQCTNLCRQAFPAHQAVVLSLIPEMGWQLTGWTGDCDALGNVILDRDKFCSPVVTPIPLVSYVLTVTGIEHGRVTSQPDGIQCIDQCSQKFADRQTVTLSLIPETGWQLAGWTGDCDMFGKVVLDRDKNCHPVVTSLPPETVNYVLTIVLIGSGSGSVMKSSEDVKCNKTCAQSYLEGTSIPLAAQEEIGSKFIGWEGDCQGEKRELTLTMTQAKTCQARFEPVPPAAIIDHAILTQTQETNFISSILTHPDCPLSGKVNNLCNYGGQSLVDMEVLEQGNISNGVLSDGTLINHGWVSNLVLTGQSVLTGGIVTGSIENEGLMKDFEFRGISLVGGRLAGKVTNTSAVGGYLMDVELAPNTLLQGGRLQGRIMGDPKSPAKLEHVLISPGSHLSGVIFGENVIVAEGVTIDLEQETLCPQLPRLGEAQQVNPEGTIEKVDTQFAGGIVVGSKTKNSFRTQVVVKPLTPVTLQSCLVADSKQVGQKADLVVYGTYQSSPEEVPIDLMIDSHGRFCSWDKRPEHLTAFRKQVTLASLVIDLYKCLPAMLGTMKFYVGYRLADGTIVSASSPLEVIGKKE